MIYGSVCSGIESASVAWAPLGWSAAWFSEIEKFPSAVLAHHYPNVPNLGDMTKLENHLGRTPIDLLVGGTPCQSFSIAGLRKGMADARGNLALVFILLLRRTRAPWCLWENVPGVLSSGNDFGCFLGGLVGRELAKPEEGWGSFGIIEPTTPDDYGVAWRVLDAQYFGVPQHRRRVFVVGYLGDWRRAAAVLFEPESLRRNPPPSRKAGQGFTRDVGRSLKASGGFKGAEDHETLIAHSLRGEGFDASEDGTGRGVPLVPFLLTMREGCAGGGKGPLVREDSSGALATGNNQVPFDPQVFDMRGNGDGVSVPTLTGHHAGAISDFSPVVFTQGNIARGIGPRPSNEVAPTFQSNAGDQHPCVFTQNSRSEVREMGDRTGAVTSEPGAQCQNYLKAGMAVRRLTPRECERLQGFPDDYTLIGWRGKPQENCSDGPRYKACGNSMAVPVMRWIGERIQAVDDIIKKS